MEETVAAQLGLTPRARFVSFAVAAADPLVWANEVGADMGRVNVSGGAIALGHAVGSSGTRVFSTLLSDLERTGGCYGLQVICEGAGMANATIIERL